jgi:hypothetical protein
MAVVLANLPAKWLRRVGLGLTGVCLPVIAMFRIEERAYVVAAVAGVVALAIWLWTVADRSRGLVPLLVICGVDAVLLVWEFARIADWDSSWLHWGFGLPPAYLLGIAFLLDSLAERHSRTPSGPRPGV